MENIACRDERDIHILKLAMKGNADIIITGDEDLLEIKQLEKTRIMTAKDFCLKYKE